MLGKYLKILDESLDKKIDILKELDRLSREQSSLIDEGASLEDIDANMDAKDSLITEILKLDEGFEALYEDIRVNLKENKDEYKTEIDGIRGKITTVMEYSTSIEAVEARNKDRMETRFAQERKDLQDRRKASTAAYDYYRVSSKLTAVPPQFMDKKK